MEVLRVDRTRQFEAQIESCNRCDTGGHLSGRADVQQLPGLSQILHFAAVPRRSHSQVLTEASEARQLPDSDPILPAMLHSIKSVLFPYTQLRSSVCTVVARQELKTGALSIGPLPTFAFGSVGWGYSRWRW